MIRRAAVSYDGRGTGKLTRTVLKRTEELRGHPPVDMEGALSASAHSEVVVPRAGRGGTTSSNPLCSSGESANSRSPRELRVNPKQAYLHGELCGVRPGGTTSFSIIQAASAAGHP